MAENGERLLDDLMRFKPASLTANAWAVKAGVSRNIWADIRRHGNPSRRTMQKLLTAADSSLAEFEALRIGDSAGIESGFSQAQVGDLARSWRQAYLPPLPVVDSRQGGEWGDVGSGIELTVIRPDRVMDRLPRPASLAADPAAYAVAILGDSMWPRYRPGRRVAVSPSAPVGVGDDVVVLFGDDGDLGQKCLIKELVRRRAASLELRQFNPDAVFAVPGKTVVAVHKIVGELF